MKYPAQPGFKEKAGCSQGAAEMMLPKQTKLHEEILKCIKSKTWATPEEVAEALNEDILCIRPRFTEMKLLGLIEKTPFREKNKRGNNVAIWEAVL